MDILGLEKAVLEITKSWPGTMVQGLRSLVAIPEAMIASPRTHMETDNCL